MLTSLRLRPHDSSGRWQWRQNQWRSGESWIEPVVHPLLETIVVSDGTRRFITVRERWGDTTNDSHSASHAGHTQDYEHRLETARTWPLEFVLIEFDEHEPCRLTAGQWGTAPIYLHAAAGVLHGSWSLDALRPYMSTQRLCPTAVTRTLTQRLRYSRQTEFDQVFQLTERSTAEFDASGLRMRYPADALHARPRTVKAGIDLVEVYWERLGRALSHRPHRRDTSAVELSGGIDSSCVAVRLAAVDGPSLHSYALTYGGASGAQQRDRRQELLRILRPATDRLEPVLELPPLHPTGRRASGVPVPPREEPYEEAFAHLLNTVSAYGVDTVFTGDGGDELLGLRDHEWEEVGKIPGRYAPSSQFPDWLGATALEQVSALDDAIAPAPVLSPATLLGFACRTPLFLRAGMWPISALSDPELIRFCEQLPLDYRAGKRLGRDLLRRQGLSADFLTPPLRENFGHVMPAALRQYGTTLLRKHLDHSVLADLGYIDADRVLDACDRVDAGDLTPANTLLFQVLSLDLWLAGLV